jgi:hypothetical protein
MPYLYVTAHIYSGRGILLASSRENNVGTKHMVSNPQSVTPTNRRRGK